MAITNQAPAPDHIHHPPASVYLKAFGALMALLIATVVASRIDLYAIIPIPGLNLIVAMIIAVMKAAIVVLFFMNVRGSSRLTWLWATIGFLWLFIMAGILIDYGSRGMVKVPGWQ